ncbi:hypothetical protein [Aequorivita capsosiphonis]|uniref:hypothetical protein n=1 Tax=Aequorivita capsosiphonis TaxID=487317 RepID=UPI000413E927|nr:hypothetical protein [Aequorivita capsosiphonis]
MKTQRFCDGEERRLNWLITRKLPNTWKRIGWAIFIVSLVLILLNRFIDINHIVFKSILKNTMLVGLLIVIISKEKIEDELVENLRSKAFSFAFIMGVAWVLVQPLLNYLVSFLIKPQDANYQDLGDFQILWFLLIIYLTIFWFLKKRNS